MTKKQAQQIARKKIKSIVRSRSQNFTVEAYHKFGLALIKKEIFDARKDVSVVFNALLMSWEAVHMESGVLS